MKWLRHLSNLSYSAYLCNPPRGGNCSPSDVLTFLPKENVQTVFPQMGSWQSQQNPAPGPQGSLPVLQEVVQQEEQLVQPSQQVTRCPHKMWKQETYVGSASQAMVMPKCVKKIVMMSSRMTNWSTCSGTRGALPRDDDDDAGDHDDDYDAQEQGVPRGDTGSVSRLPRSFSRLRLGSPWRPHWPFHSSTKPKLW